MRTRSLQPPAKFHSAQIIGWVPTDNSGRLILRSPQPHELMLYSLVVAIAALHPPQSELGHRVGRRAAIATITLPLLRPRAASAGFAASVDDIS